MMDKTLADKGHTVLRLLLDHPNLNPIKLVWSDEKQWVTKKNPTLKIKDVEQLCLQRFKMGECVSACVKTKNVLL
jgi:hypothetical protein